MLQLHGRMMPSFVQRLLQPSGSGGGRWRSGSAAQRLQAGLPTLRRTPAQWRKLLVHAVDLQSEINALEPQPGLTGKWRKDKQHSDSVSAAPCCPNCNCVVRSPMFRTC